MIAKGEILRRADDGRVVVAARMDCGDEETCKSCGLCAHAGEAKPENVIEVRVDALDGAEVGDVVEMDLRTPNPAVVSFVVFGIPLILTVVGGVLGHWLAPARDLYLVLGGGGGFVCGFACVGLLGRRVAGLQASASVRRLIKKREAAEAAPRG